MDESGTVEVLQRPFPVSEDLANQILRCEIDITHDQIKFYTISHSSPAATVCVREEEYTLPLHPGLTHNKQGNIYYIGKVSLVI